MKHILVLLIAVFGLSIVAHGEIFWAGVWYHTKSPLPSDRLQGPLEVRLETNGTVQANFFLKSGHSFNSTASTNGTWRLERTGVYHLSFFVERYMFTGTVRNNLMTGRFETTVSPNHYAGKFQCTLFDDEE